MPQRIYGLDLLRAVAILMVLVQHGNYILVDIVPAEVLSLFVFDGIAVFFVLSGFLIGDILLREVSQKGSHWRVLWHFWLRRWFRTLPNYFLVLSLVVIANVWLQKLHVVDIWHYFLFAQNLFLPHPTFFPEAWSLCVEEWFYLLLPFSIFVLLWCWQGNSKQAFLRGILLFVVLCTILRFYRWNSLYIESLHDWDLWLRKQVFTRLDALAFGVLAAWLRFYYPKLWQARPRSYLLLGIALLLSHKILNELRYYQGRDWNVYFSVFYFTVESWAVMLVLPFLSQYTPCQQRLGHKAIRHISVTSYSLYLLHLTPIMYMVVPAIMRVISGGNATANCLLRYLLYWACSLVFATLLYRFFELPTTRWREKWAGAGAREG